MNRETWLETAVLRLRPWFSEVGYPLPETVSVSCGWPKHSGTKSTSLGQTFDGRSTADGSTQIFISPSLEREMDVLTILLRQLAHAAVGTGAGHTGPYLKLIRALGMVGKATEATLGNQGLNADVTALAANLGDYPHSAMSTRRQSSLRPAGGGWVKFRSSIHGDGYILRVSPKSLSDHGAPRGPSGEEMEKC